MRLRAASGTPAPDGDPSPAVAKPILSAGLLGWAGASSPIVLRLPRGLAVLLVLGLLLLIMMAYWVGASRGRAAADAAYAQSQAVVVGSAGPRGVGEITIYRPSEPPAGGGRGSGGGGADEPGADPVQPVRTTFDDRRERGLNYFRLVVTSREEGEGIADFMARNGIDIQLVLVDNDRSCIVYAVDRGFRSDERDSDARLYYESKLKELGDLWRQQGSGYSGFSTAYLELYKGPDAD